MMVKTLALFAAVAVASVSAQTTPCDVQKLGPLVVDPNVQQCQTDSGLAIPPVGVIPTEVLTKACASTACKGVLAKVLSLNVGDCSVGSFQIERDLVNPFKKVCPSGVPESASAGSSAGSAAAGTPEVEVTTKPVTKEETTTSGSGSSSTPKDDTKSDTTKAVPTPAPTKTSGASAITVTAGAAVVAVAASLW